MRCVLHTFMITFADAAQVDLEHDVWRALHHSVDGPVLNVHGIYLQRLFLQADELPS